jgi:hypothetical protein
MDSLAIMVDVCVVDEGRKASWMRALDQYTVAMVLLCKKDDFTNEEIASFQGHANKFFKFGFNYFRKRE